MKLRLKLLVSIILIVTVSLLAVQNGLLLVLSSENSDSERESYGGAPLSARYVQIPPTLSLLHPQRRELHFSRSSPNSTPLPHASVDNHTARSLQTILAKNQSKTNLVSNIHTANTFRENTTQNNIAATTMSAKNSTKKNIFRSYEDIRESIKQRNKAKKAANTSIPFDYNYKHWDDRKKDKSNDYPFYSNDSPVSRAPVPTDIAALFPTNFSNTTLLSRPPRQSFSFGKKSGDIFTNKGIDIFELLSRWDKTYLQFYNEADRLRIDIKDPPVPRACKLTPGPRLVEKLKIRRWRKHAECFGKVRKLTPFELEGNHILFTVRTSAKYHSERLPRLFHTWLANVNRSNVVIITDDFDPVLQYRTAEAGLKYLVSVAGYDKLCDKAGDEISLMFLAENSHYEWFCHVDDDVYVNLDRLVDVLANFGRDEPVYFGRAGTKPGEPRRVLPEAKLGTPGTPYHFAVGGMYCLSRTLLDKARRWIGGREAFRKMCNVTNEPEDVTIGFVVGVLLGLELDQTGLIHSHGNDLYGVNPASLKYQVGISYGYGSVQWSSRPNNVVTVPHRIFTPEEDPSQFLSLHCHYHSTIGWCINKMQFIYRRHRRQLRS